MTDEMLEKAEAKLTELRGEGELSDDALSGAAGGVKLKPDMTISVGARDPACWLWECRLCNKGTNECEHDRLNECGSCWYYHSEKGIYVMQSHIIRTR